MPFVVTQAYTGRRAGGGGLNWRGKKSCLSLILSSNLLPGFISEIEGIGKKGACGRSEMSLL